MNRNRIRAKSQKEDDKKEEDARNRAEPNGEKRNDQVTNVEQNECFSFNSVTKICQVYFATLSARLSLSET